MLRNESGNCDEEMEEERLLQILMLQCGTSGVSRVYCLSRNHVYVESTTNRLVELRTQD